MPPNLEARLQRLERRADDESLCADPQCQHLEFVRLLRRCCGEPEYPLPQHMKRQATPGDFVKLLADLNRRPEAVAS